MSSARTPRDTIEHEVQIGQVYKDKRNGDMLILVYLDSAVYLLRDEDHNHRLGKRRAFDENVRSGRFTLQPEHDGFGNTGRLSRVQERVSEYRGRDGRKHTHYADALTEALSILTDDESEQDREPVPFEELNGIGESAAENLRAAGYTTKMDIRHADDSELLDVSWVGEKGVTSIRKYV